LVALYLSRRRCFDIVRDPLQTRLDQRIGFAMRVVAYLLCMFPKLVEQTHCSTTTAYAISHPPIMARRPARA
jgi:hypothetical protein